MCKSIVSSCKLIPPCFNFVEYRFIFSVKVIQSILVILPNQINVTTITSETCAIMKGIHLSLYTVCPIKLTCIAYVTKTRCNLKVSTFRNFDVTVTAFTALPLFWWIWVIYYHIFLLILTIHSEFNQIVKQRFLLVSFSSLSLDIFHLSKLGQLDSVRYKTIGSHLQCVCLRPILFCLFLPSPFCHATMSSTLI